MKYTQYLLNPRQKGEVLTAALVNKQPVEGDDENKKSQSEASKHQNADELIDCVREVGIIAFHQVNEGDRLACVHSI